MITGNILKIEMFVYFFISYMRRDTKNLIQRKNFSKNFLLSIIIIIISMYYLRSIELELDFYLISSKLFNSYKNIFVFLYISHDK